MKPKIYFVGGASASGKTTATRRLAQFNTTPVVELDDLQRLIMPVIPELELRIVAMRSLALELVRRFQLAGARCVVEGGWIEPEQAAALRAESDRWFYPIYCGYCGTTVEERFAVIRSQDSHWLAREPEVKARCFLEEQIANSETLRLACERLAIPYIDFSSFTPGTTALEENFRSWEAGSR